MTGLNTLRGSLIDVINHIIATSQFQAYRIYLSQQQLAIHLPLVEDKRLLAKIVKI